MGDGIDEAAWKLATTRSRFVTDDPAHPALKLQLYYTHVIEIWSHSSGLGYVQIHGCVLFFLLYLVEITIFY